MDTLLIAVTALSLLMAAAMALVLMKLLRDERRRSDARVAALTEMAGDSAATNEIRSIRLQPEDTRPTRSFRLQPEETAADLPLRPTADFRQKPDANRQREVQDTAGIGNLFAEPERSSPWGRRFVVIATLAAVVATTGWVLFRSAPSQVEDSQSAQVAAPVTPTPLELLSLRHTQDAGRLTITGLVQNPRGAAPRARVVATAFAFGPDGTFLASGRAPLDVTSLAGGDQSPFVVTVPVAGAVARYRVGFRAEDGTVIAHVDKRTDTLAQK